jgi:putative ABC transport system substrate-binding protein
MRRRDLTGVAALLLPLAAYDSRAQEGRRLPQVGILWPSGPNVALEAAFHRRMAELGYIDAQTYRLHRRNAEGRLERLPELARQLVALRVDVIVAPSVANSVAARGATRTIPIVMVAAGDPIGAGLITTLNRPGGNVTGTASMQPELAAKQVETLLQALPATRHVAVLVNPTSPGTPPMLLAMESAADRFRLATTVIEIRRIEDVEPALDAVVGSGADALLVSMEGLIGSQRELIIAFAARQRLAAFYTVGDAVRAGGLISYGPTYDDHYARAADFVDRILRGANPADMPVEQPTRFELVVNQRTARALGITVSPSILLSADEVIE